MNFYSDRGGNRDRKRDKTRNQDSETDKINQVNGVRGDGSNNLSGANGVLPGKLAFVYKMLCCV